MSDKRRFSDMDQKIVGPLPDSPPFSRLFVVCYRDITEECIREEFGKFGNIEEVWMVRDRVTGEHKGMSTTGAISIPNTVRYEHQLPCCPHLVLPIAPRNFSRHNLGTLVWNANCSLSTTATGFNKRP